MSTCAPTDRLLQTIKVQVPGVTDDLINIQLFNVMDEFFRRTSAWLYHSQITLVENIVEYDLGTPADTVVVRLMGVIHNGIPVPSVSQAGGQTQNSIGTLEPQMQFPDGDISVAWDKSDMESNVFSYAIYRPDYISITALPDDESRKYPLETVTALSLAKGCLECDDCGSWPLEEWMWDMFFGDFLDGTLGRLYGMPAKPWMSREHALYHGRRFRNHMGYRKQEALRGFTYNQPPRWLFPRGGWI